MVCAKRECAAGERLLARADLIVGGDKDQRDLVAIPDELLLDIKAIHPRHLHVENHTVGLKRGHRLKEIEKSLSRAECFCIHRNRAHQPSNGAADRCVVIHYHNERLGLGQGDYLCAAVERVSRCRVKQTLGKEGRCVYWTLVQQVSVDGTGIVGRREKLLTCRFSHRSDRQNRRSGVYSALPMPTCSAKRTNSARDCTSIFSITRARCTLTVFSTVPS